MGATPVLNQYGGGIGTNTAAPGVATSGMFNMPGMSNSGMNPIGGSGQNPTGTAGGSNNGAGVPMANAHSVSGNPGANTGVPAGGSPAPTASPIPTTATPTPQGTVTSLAPTATGENNQTITNNQQTQEQTNRTLGELQTYYGEGVGSYLYNLMQTGGINENVANQTNTADVNAMQGSINQGSANLNSTLGAQGVSGNSSTSALANSQYQQGATAQENAVINQNYMSEYTQGQQMLESILPGIMKTNQEGTANQPSVLDEVLGGVGALAGGITGISAIGSGISSLGGLFGGGGSSNDGITSEMGAGLLDY